MKYRALIVDDEPIILSGLLRLPVWLVMDVQPVSAMNGIQAVSIVENERIDMVITDIRMPEMDGLELIAALRKTAGELPIIVMSGYDSFEYAKESIHYGVSDYLLKPVSQTDLTDTITRIIYHIEERKEQERQEALLKGRLRQTVFDAGAKLLESCLLGKGEETKLESRLGAHGILAVCTPLRHTDGERVESLNILLDGLSQMMLRLFEPGHGIVTLFMQTVVFTADTGNVGAETLIKRMEEWSGKVDFPFAVSYMELNDVLKIPFTYGKLMEIAAYGFYHKDFCVLAKEDMLEREDTIDFSRLESVVKGEVVELAYKELEEVILSLKRKNQTPMRTREDCTRLYLLLSGYMNEQERNKRITELLMLKGGTDFESLATMLRQLLYHWEIARSEKKIQSYSTTVRTAISYIHSHLNDEELSVSLIANQVLFLHPDYLSKLFKKETGIAFSHFVMELRMEKARQLLMENQDIKVYELSEATGFGGNPHYFSQVFRTCYGCTPSEYKKIRVSLLPDG